MLRVGVNAVHGRPAFVIASTSVKYAVVDYATCLPGGRDLVRADGSVFCHVCGRCVVRKIYRAHERLSFADPLERLRLLLPVAIVFLQNNLAYVATSHLDGPTYQIICQSKILITALLSVAILGKSLASKQWVSLAALTVGVALVQLSGSESGEEASIWEFTARMIAFPG